MEKKKVICHANAKVVLLNFAFFLNILFVCQEKMDVNKLCTKIKELGHINSKRDELREYCKLKFDQVL